MNRRKDKSESHVVFVQNTIDSQTEFLISDFSVLLRLIKSWEIEMEDEVGSYASFVARVGRASSELREIEGREEGGGNLNVSLLSVIEVSYYRWITKVMV